MENLCKHGLKGSRQVSVPGRGRERLLLFRGVFLVRKGLFRLPKLVFDLVTVPDPVDPVEDDLLVRVYSFDNQEFIGFKPELSPQITALISQIKDATKKDAQASGPAIGQPGTPGSAQMDSSALMDSGSPGPM